MRSTQFSDSSSAKEKQANLPKFDPATFDKYAALYERMTSWPYRKELELPTLEKLLGDLSGLNVLDFGCGPGVISRWLNERGAKRIVGHDISEGMLNYARRREEKESLGIHYISKINEDYNVYFDIVLAVYVIPYAANYKDLMAMSQTMARVLKPGGRLLTLPIHPDFNSDPEYYRPFGFRLIEEQPRTDGSSLRLHICQPPYDINIQAYYWSRPTLENVLQQIGFQTVNWKPLNVSANPLIPNLSSYVQCPHAAILECIRGNAC
ncbi:methyltransferase domain-containing protein [Xenorhabdus sp. XENO-10]|uniref:Methyltransferase domain-containing protein n=1 Tax=Xenorhabdus yunnanensis TaxID=3025878 RepID=A0ABT5LKV7_9GAMM|nr:class I SAM-dependent methyltransferase [Xenorhabdus yunnanensis]MDC9590385.1 methyltransferase domain-containing protein [Xenorhabdus yunnanensis]